jgi:hypothetical protein
VSPDGDDVDGNGTRAKPYATIGRAIEEASASERRVYACADSGAYQERVAVDGSADGLELFGGFSCDDWTYSEAAKSRVTSPSTLALHVDHVAGLRIEDFDFEAADASEPGESSVGAFVVGSTDILMRRVRLEAGAGMNAESGATVDFTFPDRTELDGNQPTGSNSETGGAEKLYSTCPGSGVTSGAIGGSATAGGQDGGSGAPDYSGPGGEGGDAGVLNCGAGGTGKNGGDAPTQPASLGASILGSLTLVGWTAVAGVDGAPGLPGQGGGGGASSATRGGGGGGAGGCGGAGGTAGKGGGGSISLIVLQGQIRLADSELVAHDAGAGGDGAPGQAGQTPGGFGANGGGLGACPGGAGGGGGRGGAGGGGAGGISVGILWSGSDAPMRTGGTITVGEAGRAGVGGDPGNNDGIAGVADQVLEVP